MAIWTQRHHWMAFWVPICTFHRIWGKIKPASDTPSHLSISGSPCVPPTLYLEVRAHISSLKCDNHNHVYLLELTLQTAPSKNLFYILTPHICVLLTFCAYSQVKNTQVKGYYDNSLGLGSFYKKWFLSPIL